MHSGRQTECWQLSAAAWLSGGLVLAVAYRQGFTGAETLLGIAAATMAVWGISLLGLWMRGEDTGSARQLAFSHLKGSGLRMLLVLGAAVFLVAGLRLEARSVAITLVAVYFPVLSIETLAVSRRLKRLEGAVSGS